MEEITFLNSSKIFGTLLLSVSLGMTQVNADVRMPVIFGDHMVLQQDTKISVYGWADPGETVVVTFAGQKANAVAAPDGTWKVNLKPVKTTKEGQTLTVAGNNRLVYSDVVVGDVWVASGQSNMEWGIKLREEYAGDVASSQDSLLRLFFVPQNTSLEPLSDIEVPQEINNPEWAARWILCTPEALTKINGQGFSATAYYFARDMRAANGRPLGVVQSAWGGTRAEAWTSVEGLKQEPSLAHYVAAYESPLGHRGFSFVYVQLPNFEPVDSEPSAEGNGWRWVREGQLKALDLPNTAMAVTIDVGDPFELHPVDKYDVGHRLSLAARRLAYGEKIAGMGPIYKKMSVKGDKIILEFTNHGKKLMMGTSPYVPAGAEPHPAPTRLTGFGIAGADRKFVWADAVIEGNKVIVSADGVAEPVAVRYGFSNSPVCNLYNESGLPASPFRTDNWDN